LEQAGEDGKGLVMLAFLTCLSVLLIVLSSATAVLMIGKPREPVDAPVVLVGVFLNVLIAGTILALARQAGVI
jgi:hypothetical protein